MQICFTVPAVALSLKLQWRKSRKWILLGSGRYPLSAVALTEFGQKKPPFLPHYDERNGTNQISSNSSNFVWFDEEFRWKFAFFHSFRAFFIEIMILICKWDANEWRSRWILNGFQADGTEWSAGDLLVKFRSKRIDEWPICTGPPDGRGPDYSNEPNVDGFGPAEEHFRLNLFDSYFGGKFEFLKFNWIRNF